MDKPAKIVVALVIIVVSGFFIFSKISGWHKSKLENAVKKEQEVWQGKANILEQKVSALRHELTEVKVQEVQEEKLETNFAEEEKQGRQQAEETQQPSKRPSRIA